MANLVLGRVIWLNVSRKLLSFHRYFFTPFNEVPKEVQHEFRRHSHTHPSVTVASTTSSHTDYVYVSWNATYEHEHYVDMAAADSHSHASVVLAFGSAELGSPNWWEHVHPITLTSMGSAGASHTHTLASSTNLEECYIGGEPCGYYHSHGNGSPTQGSAGAAHTHTLGTVYTGNAVPGTPEAHVHPFNINTNYYSDPSHSFSGSVTAYWCYDYVSSHGHTYNANSVGDQHLHGLSGNTGEGGEAPAVVGRVVGDGLTWVVMLAKPFRLQAFPHRLTSTLRIQCRRHLEVLPRQPQFCFCLPGFSPLKRALKY